MSLLDSLKHWLNPQHSAPSTQHWVGGLRVTVNNTRPDIDTTRVIQRLGQAIELIDRYTPHYGRHLRRDFAGILVERYACRGAFFPQNRICMVELTFSVNPTMTLPQIAATILHEGMHARLHALGFPMEMEDRARQERFCRRAEIEFGRLVPGGEVVVERAMQSLGLADHEVAPEIDWRLAAERVAAVDRQARRTPPR
jgi:hypothetical protein